MKKAGISMVMAGLLLMVAMVYSADVEHGKAVYKEQKCSICHSIAKVGGKIFALDGVGGKLSGADIKKWITAPKSMKADTKMKAYPSMVEKDLEDLTEYLLTVK